MKFHRYFMVRFLEKPYSTIDSEVCVPFNWVQLDNKTNEIVAVAYPAENSPSIRKMVRNMDLPREDWRYYKVQVICTKKSFKSAEKYLKSRSNIESEKTAYSNTDINETKAASNTNTRSSNQSSSESRATKKYRIKELTLRNNRLMPLKLSIKRPMPNITVKDLFKKRTKTTKMSELMSKTTNHSNESSTDVKMCNVVSHCSRQYSDEQLVLGSSAENESSSIQTHEENLPTVTIHSPNNQSQESQVRRNNKLNTFDEKPDGRNSSTCGSAEYSTKSETNPRLSLKYAHKDPRFLPFWNNTDRTIIKQTQPAQTSQEMYGNDLSVGSPMHILNISLNSTNQSRCSSDLSHQDESPAMYEDSLHHNLLSGNRPESHFAKINILEDKTIVISYSNPANLSSEVSTIIKQRQPAQTKTNIFNSVNSPDVGSIYLNTSSGIPIDNKIPSTAECSGKERKESYRENVHSKKHRDCSCAMESMPKLQISSRSSHHTSDSKSSVVYIHDRHPHEYPQRLSPPSINKPQSTVQHVLDLMNPHDQVSELSSEKLYPETFNGQQQQNSPTQITYFGIDVVKPTRSGENHRENPRSTKSPVQCNQKIVEHNSRRSPEHRTVSPKYLQEVPRSQKPAGSSEIIHLPEVMKKIPPPMQNLPNQSEKSPSPKPIVRGFLLQDPTTEKLFVRKCNNFSIPKQVTVEDATANPSSSEKDLRISDCKSASGYTDYILNESNVEKYFPENPTINNVPSQCNPQHAFENKNYFPFTTKMLHESKKLAEDMVKNNLDTLFNKIDTIKCDRNISSPEDTTVTSGNNQHNGNNDNRDEADKTTKKRRAFILPRDYDPISTRWTLKYQEPGPGLTELMSHSKIYINAIKFFRCKSVANDCKTLARNLLMEIFSLSALSVCSLTGARTCAHNVSDVRPGLDKHAISVILTFVDEYGKKKTLAFM